MLTGPNYQYRYQGYANKYDNVAGKNITSAAPFCSADFLQASEMPSLYFPYVRLAKTRNSM